MIVIYPMLISDSVSPNVIPGICKAIEKYLITYNTDEILKSVNISLSGIIQTGAQIGQIAQGIGVIKNIAGMLSIKEGIELEEQKKPSSKTTQVGTTNVNIQGSIPSSGGGAKPSLELPRSESLSLEPTWIQVTTKRKGLQILGIKVIPFRVKAGESMVQMILKDQQMKFMSYLAHKYVRAAGRVVWRLMRAFRVPIIKDKAISGNPKVDIVYAGTGYGKDMFICFNQQELEEETFNKPNLVQRIHKLGWSSFIVMDDVNKKATFCMKEFKGVCSVVPYGFIFSSIGKDHAKVYEDLEDLKKSAGPFFSMKTNRKKVMSEGRTRRITSALEDLYND